MEKTKVCIKCGRELTVDNFSKSKVNKDGLRGECRKCLAEYHKKYNKTYNQENKVRNYERQKQWKIDNKEVVAKRDSKYRQENIVTIREQSKKYRQENKEVISDKAKRHYQENIEKEHEKSRAYRENNKETRTTTQRKYMENNRDKILEHKRQFYQTNKAAHAEYGKKYYEINKEHIAVRVSRWQKEHKETVNTATNRRRSRKRLLPATLTPAQWEAIKQHFNNTCCYCGKGKPLEQEHFIPVTNSGSYDINNIIPACRSCNGSKTNKSFEIWYPKYKYYSKEREKIILNFLNYKKNIQQLSISY